MTTIWNEDLNNVIEPPPGCQGAGSGGPKSRSDSVGIGGAAEPASPERAPGPATMRPAAARCARLGRPAWTLVAATLLALGAPAAQSAETATRVAVLDIELLKADYLPNADRITPDERRRLDMIADLLRERLQAEGYDPVSAARTRAAIVAADPGQYLHECNGCELDIGRDLGADWVAVGWVQIVSYLIINLNVMVFDVESGAPVGRAFVDLRGNTERSWRRATLYLLDNILVDRLARHR